MAMPELFFSDTHCSKKGPYYRDLVPIGTILSLFIFQGPYFPCFGLINAKNLNSVCMYCLNSLALEHELPMALLYLVPWRDIATVFLYFSNLTFWTNRCLWLCSIWLPGKTLPSLQNT